MLDLDIDAGNFGFLILFTVPSLNLLKIFSISNDFTLKECNWSVILKYKDK